jgi:hypothetical protein
MRLRTGQYKKKNDVEDFRGGHGLWKPCREKQRGLISKEQHGKYIELMIREEGWALARDNVIVGRWH